MSAQRQKPIDFAAEGLRLALSADRNYGIRVYFAVLKPSECMRVDMTADIVKNIS
jgi:hypothetical protein